MNLNQWTQGCYDGIIVRNIDLIGLRCAGSEIRKVYPKATRIRKLDRYIPTWMVTIQGFPFPIIVKAY